MNDLGLPSRVQAFVRDGIDLSAPRPTAAPSPFWQALRAVGSELWLDTGDLAAAGKLWTPEFSALTTNNTLLNKEIQTGYYDRLIADAARMLGSMDPAQKVLEIAFILNARHALRLVQRFGGKVSVELHTDLAHDVERSVEYGRRYHAICPEHFIVKVPHTAAGLIAARRIADAGIPVNFTLGFSARQNHIAAMVARPAWVNVFLGRLNAYVKDNGLGSGDLVGEKALLASQREMTALGGRTRQIAASLRGAGQVRDLAGCDVFTMPTAVAEAAVKELDGRWTSRSDQDYQVAFTADANAIRAECLWAVSPAERAFAADLAKRMPTTAAELIDRAHAAGCGDCFPKLAPADLARIAADGKIPKHAAWAERIAKRELAIDTLLNLAGLASFTADQKALDERIRGNMG
ncbi:MAG: transaldolase [Planctomycetes bacterium]|nr:transaldolase [Planctomycetota bacterium]